MAMNIGCCESESLAQVELVEAWGSSSDEDVVLVPQASRSGRCADSLLATARRQFGNAHLLDGNNPHEPINESMWLVYVRSGTAAARPIL